jgi:hypothetical protein
MDDRRDIGGTGPPADDAGSPDQAVAPDEAVAPDQASAPDHTASVDRAGQPSSWTGPPAKPSPDRPAVGWGAQWQAAQPPPLTPPRGRIAVGSVLGRAIDLFLRRPLVFIALALPTTILSAVSVPFSTGMNQNPAMAAVLIPIAIVAVVVGVATGLAMIMAADDLRAGRTVPLGTVARRAIGRAVIAILSSIAEYFAIVGLLLLGAIGLVLLSLTRSIPLVVIAAAALLVVFLYVILRWSLSYPSIALEQTGPLQALGRSRAVTRGNVLRIVGVYLLLALTLLPLAIGVGILSLSLTEPLIQVGLGALAGFVTAPLVATLSTTIFGDLTGRPEVDRQPRSNATRGAFLGALFVVGVVALAIGIPQLGPAMDRMAFQSIPLADRGRILAGIARNPIDPCRPIIPQTTFDDTDPIYVGGYFTKPVPRGQSARVDVFIDGQVVNSASLGDPSKTVACYYERDPLVGASPGTYRIVVSLGGETIAEGTFAIQ